MPSIKYAKLYFCNSRGAEVEAEVSYELDGSDFDIEELNIDGSVYDMRKQSATRRLMACNGILYNHQNVWDAIMEYEHELNDIRRESYELRHL